MLYESEKHLRDVESKLLELETEKETVSKEIDKLKEDISRQQVGIIESFRSEFTANLYPLEIT